MTRTNWLRRSQPPRSTAKRLLEDRIVYCANCDGNRTLSTSSSGTLTCSSCSSDNWMYLSAPLVQKFRQYDEKKVRERSAVNRYLNKLENDFLTSGGVIG